jgi:HEAT repeats
VYSAKYSVQEQDAILVLHRHQPAALLLTLAHKLVADVVGDIGKPIPTLLTFLHGQLDSTDWEVRVKTIKALGKIRRGISDETIRKLEGLWHDPHQPSSVHNAVDDALGEILVVDEVEDGEVPHV